MEDEGETLRAETERLMRTEAPVKQRDKVSPGILLEGSTRGNLPIQNQA